MAIVVCATLYAERERERERDIWPRGKISLPITRRRIDLSLHLLPISTRIHDQIEIQNDTRRFFLPKKEIKREKLTRERITEPKIGRSRRSYLGRCN